MNAVPGFAMLPQILERRSTHRLAVALPVILDLGAKKLSARLVDLGPGGGRVEVGVMPLPRAQLTLRCGTIVAKAKVAWVRGDQVGLQFRTLLTDRQIAEQVRRTFALQSRRAPNCGIA